MAKGYKRDSRGRFNGGYGAGALGGKGAYASRAKSGGTSAMAKVQGAKAQAAGPKPKNVGNNAPKIKNSIDTRHYSSKIKNKDGSITKVKGVRNVTHQEKSDRRRSAGAGAIIGTIIAPGVGTAVGATIGYRSRRKQYDRQAARAATKNIKIKR